MWFLDSDIDEINNLPSELNKIYKIVEYLQKNLNDKTILSEFNKNNFITELSKIFYLGGFDIYALKDYVTKQNLYYVTDIKEIQNNKKLIYFSFCKHDKLIQKYNKEKIHYFLYNKENQKWKKII